MKKIVYVVVLTNENSEVVNVKLFLNPNDAQKHVEKSYTKELDEIYRTYDEDDVEATIHKGGALIGYEDNLYYWSITQTELED